MNDGLGYWDNAYATYRPPPESQGAEMVLRIPNPESDISRLIRIYRLINTRNPSNQTFDLDTISKILVESGQASSRGVAGQEALMRSHNQNRSLDPLYNQSKMYSELFRMLGWLRPGDNRHEHQTTFLGDEVAHSEHIDSYTKALIGESFLGIVFPNPCVRSSRIVNLRPFPWLLKIISSVGGHITRHEMILGLLSVTDDQSEGAYEAATEQILRVRGSLDNLYNAVDYVAKANKVMRTTLENYTRVPVGVLKSPILDWGKTERLKGLYEKTVQAISLTDTSQNVIDRLYELVDVREQAIMEYTPMERANFAIVAYFAMLDRAGWSLKSEQTTRDQAWRKSRRITNFLEIDEPLKILYSPFQQAPEDILQLASQIIR